jgi:flagellar biosynthetic protein FliQ
MYDTPGIDVGQLLREAMLVSLKLGGPPLAAALVVGTVMSLFQAVTQINEQTLAFLPKVAAIVGTIAVLGTFMMTAMGDFMRHVMSGIAAGG